MKYSLREFEESTELNEYEPLVQRLLCSRGIKDKKVAEKFLSKEWTCETPFVFNDMEKAVSRFLRAMEDNEKIAVFSDYDCDGICGAATVHPLFKKLDYNNFEIIIPDRHHEGYGLSSKHIQQMADSGTKVLITIDCGVANMEELTQARELGIDVIVVDHHEFPKELPPMYALIHHQNKTGEESPLCGTATVFKFVCGVCERKRDVIKEGWEKWLLDVVSIATVADMVPLVNENRILVHYGLIVLRKTRRIGLNMLLKKLNMMNALTEDDIGFMISPRINAASRMGNAYDAFIFLTTEDETEAREKMKLLESLNNKRKGVVASMTKEVRASLDDNNKNEVRVFGESVFRPSLVGLVAQSLMEDLDRPIFVWGRAGGGEIKGSCRSPSGTISLVEIMEKTKHCFDAYGGHENAGGFTLKEEHLFTIEEELSKAYRELESTEREQTVKHVDWHLSLDMINDNTYKTIKMFGPFGVANEKPIFFIENATISETQIFGKHKNHAKYILQTENNKMIEAVSYFNEPLEVKNKQINMYFHMDPPFRSNNPTLRVLNIEIV